MYDAPQYVYDYNGNTLTKVVGSNTTSYAWDYENRLTSVTLPGSGGTVSFAYDPFGRRIEKISPTTTSIFAYDGDNLIEATNSSGTAVARYSEGLNIDEPLAMLRSSTTSYYDADGLGSITSLISSARLAGSDLHVTTRSETDEFVWVVDESLPVHGAGIGPGNRPLLLSRQILRSDHWQVS